MENLISEYVFIVGLIIVMSVFINYGFRLINIPALVGFFLLGTVLGLINDEFGLFKTEGVAIFEFLADLGIIAMLMKIGLESNISGLVKWLPKASIIWVGDAFVSGLFGFLIAYYLLGWEFIPGLFIGTAFTATSVGISANIWDEMKAINTQAGQTLLDVAEMDDLSGILLMGILFSIAPVIHSGVQGPMIYEVAQVAGLFIIKLIVFGLICFLLSRYVVEELIEILKRLHGKKGIIVVVVGVGLIVAAISGLLGFSLAIGAFFVGLILSGNPTKIKVDASFDAIYALFVPFFFISIGFNVSFSGTPLNGLSLILLIVAAFLGKYFGAGLGAWASIGFKYSSLIGLSMIPRAEIFLIILKRGLELGSWAVSSQVFTYSVIISAASVVIAPFFLRRELKSKRALLNMKT